MPVSLNDQLLRKLLEHSVDLLRVASSAQREVRKLLLALEGEIAGRLAQSNLSATAQTRLTAVQRDVQDLIQNTYADIRDLMTERSLELAGIEAGVTAKLVNAAIRVDMLSGALPPRMLKTLFSDVMIQGAPSSAWWARQSADTIFRFVQQMRLGVAQGETNAELLQRVRGGTRKGEALPGIPGLLDKSRAEAEALVRTSVQTVANRSALEFYRAHPELFKGVQQVSTLDERTSEVCIAYDGASWDLDGKPINGTDLPFNDGPPRHFNCRSRLVGITISWEERGVRIPSFREFSGATRASMNGQVSAKTTFEDWMGGLSPERQDKILGAGKAELWRSGKITVRDLLDQSGNPLTLRDLRAQHGL